MGEQLVIFKHKACEWKAIIDDCGVNACVVTITADLRDDWKEVTGTSPFAITLDKKRIILWEVS